MAPVTKCCCFSLRTCGVIIGWLGLVASIIQLCFFIIPLEIYFKKSEEEFKEHVSKEVLEATIAGFIGYEIVEILQYSSLIYGTCKEKHLFLLPWLTISILKLTLICGLNITLIIFAINLGEGQIIFAVLCNSLVIVFFLYIVMCISSLYTNIRNKCKQNDQYFPGQIDSDALLENESSGPQFPPYRHH